MNTNTKRMVTNTMVAALYVAMTAIFSFMSFGAIQFRVSEMLNHLVGYHKSYRYGVLAGVFISNLLSSLKISLRRLSANELPILNVFTLQIYTLFFHISFFKGNYP